VQEYTGLKAVYFNSNAISRIEGLDKCTQLRCLYLEQNLLDEVRAQLTTAVQRQIHGWFACWSPCPENYAVALYIWSESLNRSLVSFTVASRLWSSRHLRNAPAMVLHHAAELGDRGYGGV
jgi:hypothetical protein